MVGSAGTVPASPPRAAHSLPPRRVFHAFVLCTKRGEMLQDRNVFDSNKTFWRAATRRSLAPQCGPATLNNVHDELGMTPLMWASMYANEPAVIELLIERSANVRAVTKHGVTALHWAAHYNKSARATEIVQALLLGGAEPTTRAKNGLTAAEFALDNGNSAVAAVLSLTGHDCEEAVSRSTGGLQRPTRAFAAACPSQSSGDSNRR
jgi:hypothetical protein